MIAFVLERLETLQAELAGVDPESEVNVTDHVAVMAKALRDVLREADKDAARSIDRGARAVSRTSAG